MAYAYLTEHMDKKARDHLDSTLNGPSHPVSSATSTVQLLQTISRAQQKGRK